MKNGHRSQPLFEYGLAVATVGLTLALKLLLVPLITKDAPFLLFFVGVTLSAWIGGLGPGLLATFLAALINFYFFMPPYNSFGLATPGEAPQVVLFVCEGVGISIICAKLRSARKRLEANARETADLERRILEISDAEQRRIGHDLHDGLGQHLTGIAFLTRHLENRLGQEKSPHAAEAAKLSDLAKTAVAWTDDLSRSLSPSALETNGLAEALGELAANADNIFDIDCTFEQEGEIDLRDIHVAVHMYRIAQEAISNAVKHGKAKHVRVQLSAYDDETRMQIIDDGSGIREPAQQQDGMGLRIMRYRAKMIGAWIDVTHADASISGESGTVVTCHYRPSNGEKRPEG